ncbi:MAG: signal peptide peptidase SppA [Elusimicrobiota bacterium]|nr:MAG: signal peptide peptidase SppA [Elusimicrobiota bacterium]
MDQIPETPGGAPLEPHQLSPRRVKRRLIAALIGLHALSLLAGVVLIVKTRGDGPKKAGSGEAGKSLLNLKPKDSVGWVSIRGPIMSSESGKPWERGAEQWARRIEQLAETKGVKAIVLDINSPGGSVGAVQEVYMRIQRVKKEKKIPFVALFGDVSASGGYYLGAACDKIVAHPGTLTGSIGVIFNVGNMEGLFAKVGYKSDPIKSGKHKDIGSPARPMTAEERQILQSLIDDAYGQFVQAVADGRKLSVEEVKPLADGRIYSGNQALQLKLVDQLGDSLDATKLAAELGGIKDEKPRVRRDTEKLNDIFELLETRARLTLGLGPAGVTVDAAKAMPRGLLYAWSGGW